MAAMRPTIGDERDRVVRLAETQILKTPCPEPSLFHVKIEGAF